jgi:DNA (cytosine-5)-methyltransferase 1
MLTVGSLFAGVGGLEKGLEDTGGFQTVWQVECDSYAQKVLKKHWPDVGRWDDVRTFPPAPAEDWQCDVICGGFPCQGISNAGKREGLNDERSGLWSEYARIVGILRPRFIVVENVPELAIRGIDAVCGTLADLGYDAEWQPVSAASVGAPHIRERLFVIAYPKSSNGERIERRTESESRHSGLCRNAMRDHEQAWIYKPRGTWAAMRQDGWGTDEPGVDRASYGVSHRVDRLRCLGNAVVPQVAQWVGERILESLEDCK